MPRSVQRGNLATSRIITYDRDSENDRARPIVVSSVCLLPPVNPHSDIRIRMLTIGTGATYGCRSPLWGYRVRGTLPGLTQIRKGRDAEDSNPRRFCIAADRRQPSFSGKFGPCRDSWHFVVASLVLGQLRCGGAHRPPHEMGRNLRQAIRRLARHGRIILVERTASRGPALAMVPGVTGPCGVRLSLWYGFGI